MTEDVTRFEGEVPVRVEAMGTEHRQVTAERLVGCVAVPGQDHPVGGDGQEVVPHPQAGQGLAQAHGQLETIRPGHLGGPDLGDEGQGFDPLDEAAQSGVVAHLELPRLQEDLLQLRGPGRGDPPVLGVEPIAGDVDLSDAARPGLALEPRDQRKDAHQHDA